MCVCVSLFFVWNLCSVSRRNYCKHTHAHTHTLLGRSFSDSWYTLPHCVDTNMLPHSEKMAATGVRVPDGPHAALWVGIAAVSAAGQLLALSSFISP